MRHATLRGVGTRGGGRGKSHDYNLPVLSSSFRKGRKFKSDRCTTCLHHPAQSGGCAISSNLRVCVCVNFGSVGVNCFLVRIEVTRLLLRCACAHVSKSNGWASHLGEE